jgi:large repetitive protein
MTTRPEPGPPGSARNTGGNSGRDSIPGHRRARRPRLVTGVAAVAAVAVLGLGATAVALSGHFGPKPSGSGQGASPGSAFSSTTAGASTVHTIGSSGGKAAFTADATVTPAATTSACAAPVTFTVAGTISATAAGTVKYQWTGSSGITGQVQTLHFSGPGTQRVTGTAVRSKTAGTGWAAIKIVSPRTATSNRATYILDCSDGPVTVSATAAVTPASSKVSCAAAPPSATFTGTIDDAKAGTVTYYWELPTGSGPTRSLAFGAPGTEPTAPATVTAASDSSTESGTLVVLSPAAVSSNTAAFSVSCTTPATSGASAPTGGASAPTGSSAPSTAPAYTTPPDVTVNLIANWPTPETVLCGSAPPGFEVFATVASNEAITGETYHWVRPDGTTTAPSIINVNAGSTSSTSDQFTPSSDNFSGTETLVFTSPVQGSWSIGLALNCSDTTPSPSPPRYGLLLVPPTGNGVEQETVGGSYLTTLTASYGTVPYAWSATGLPPGLAINPVTGTISGTPTAGGTYNSRVTVTDSSSPVESSAVVLTFDVFYRPIVTSAPTLPDGTVGTAYPSVRFSATGGDGTYSWYLAPNSNAPPGLSLSASGILSGTPTVAGTYTVYAVVDDSSDDEAAAVRTLVVNPAPLPAEGLAEAGRFRPAAYQVPHSSAGLGSSGGVRNAGGAARSSAPSGAIAAASRLVSAGRFHFYSTSFSTEVWSNTSERTQSGRA